MSVGLVPDYYHLFLYHWSIYTTRILKLFKCLEIGKMIKYHSSYHDTCRISCEMGVS